MSPRIVTGIDIGSHKTRVAISRESENGSGISIIGIGSAESRGVRNGYIAHPHDATRSVKEALARAEKAAGVSVRKAFVSLGGVSLESAVATGAVMISRIDGKVMEADIERVMTVSETNLNLSNKKIIHRFPLKFRIDGKEVLGRPKGMQGARLEVKTLFITSFNQHLDDLIAVVENAGVDVEDVVASPLAASLVTLSKAQRTAGCVLANIGAETVSVAVFEDEQLISLEVFPGGSTYITNAIALGLKIPLEEAEALKIGTVRTASIAFPQKHLDEIIETRLRSIFNLIQGHLKKIGRDGLLPAGIILTGGGGGRSSIEEIARATLALPARAAVPIALSFSPRSRVAETEKRSGERTPLDPRWSVACGLCLLGSDGYYSSDFLEFNRVKIKKHLSGVFDWFRQFVP